MCDPDLDLDLDLDHLWCFHADPNILQLSLGMFIFFALGAVGGMLSLTMQGKPIFERYVGKGLQDVQASIDLAAARCLWS
jgi:hypothetical protein